MNTLEPESSQSAPSGLQVEVGAKSARHLGKRWLVSIVVSVAAIAATGVWLYAQPGRGTGSFGPTGANPAYIVVNTPMFVTFTSQITDRQLKKRSVILLRLDASGQPTEILGRLNDDGRRGDPRAGDNTYTFLTTLNEPNIGKIGFRIAARFKPGLWREPEPDDDDWDKDLADLSADRTTRRDRLARLLRKLNRYTLSEVFFITVGPVALPPDPGEAGKQTLEGIDSDSDGVRDDIQRYIVLNHFDSAKTRAALTQYAASFQRSLMDADNSSRDLTNTTARIQALRCLFYIAGVDKAAKMQADIMPVVLNTELRSRAYIQGQRGVGGHVFPGVASTEYKAYCQFDSDSMEN